MDRWQGRPFDKKRVFIKFQREWTWDSVASVVEFAGAEVNYDQFFTPLFWGGHSVSII